MNQIAEFRQKLKKLFCRQQKNLPDKCQNKCKSLLQQDKMSIDIAMGNIFLTNSGENICSFLVTFCWNLNLFFQQTTNIIFLNT